MTAEGSGSGITLVTSNGWGLGHMSRQIAIALAIEDPARVTMFSFSRGVALAGSLGIRSEYCPGHDFAWIPNQRWNRYVEKRFQAFLSEVAPRVVLFDGVAPYPGILDALLDFPSVSAGWLRRGMWLRGRTDIQLTKSSSFDFVIEPGDIASEADSGPTAELESIKVPSVSLLEVVPRLTREEAATELGLDPARPTLLFALGTGQPGEALDARKAALDKALEKTGWQLALVTSPLANPRGDDLPGGVELEGVYPLMRYLAAFDAATSAAGYNSVHELVPARVPTLFVPKSSSQTDDQIARASFLADRDLALMADDRDPEAVRSGMDALLDGARARLLEALSATPLEDALGGAAAVARILTTTPPTGRRETGRTQWRQPGIKGFVKRSIGTRGVELVRRALGRSPSVPQRRQVSLSPEPGQGVTRLVVTSEVEAVNRSAEEAVEHILPGTSDTYRQARSQIIDDFYEVVR